MTLIPSLHDTTGCQTGLTTVLNEQPLFVELVVKPGCTTGLTTGCIQDTAGCQYGCQMGLTTRLNACIHDTAGLTTGSQTSCIACTNI